MMGRAEVDPLRLCQIEIPVGDLGRAARFYEEAFGWRPVPAELHELVVLEVPPDCPYGISLRPGRTGPNSEVAALATYPVLYFAVEDPEAILRQVESAGGSRRFGPLPLAYGTIYQCEDPDGNRLGLYKA